jgi:hypothetical protein
MFVGRVDASEGATGPTLRATFTVHLNADAAVRDAINAIRGAGAARKLARAVVRTATHAFAEDVRPDAWTVAQTGTLVRTLTH